MSSIFHSPTSSGKAILLADDEVEIREYIKTALHCRGYAVQTVPDGEEALECLRRGDEKFSLVLLDVLMPRKNGLETLRYIRQYDHELPVIMLSCASSAMTVVEAMKSGAVDFLSKPISHEDLGNAVERVLAEHVRAAPLPIPSASIQNSVSVGFVPVKSLEATLMSIGPSTVPVLIQGETGVGKEVVARRLHAQSTRADRPFLKLNCAALPSELVESELFGYERGAFTGAFQRKPGMFEVADEGTILLDEIGDMEFKLQAKLLQVLQDHEFQRVGGKQVIKVNVRVIAATHCDLEEAIVAKRFRADLYYRLNVVSLRIPPLRERPDEIIPIAEFLLRKHAQTDFPPRLPMELQRSFLSYSWPGNIRELENVIRRFLVLREAESITQELDLAGRTGSEGNFRQIEPVPGVPGATRIAGSVLDQVNDAKKDAEYQAILQALNAARWNRKKAAIALGIDYKALLYKMKKLGIDEQ